MADKTPPRQFASMDRELYRPMAANDPCCRAPADPPGTASTAVQVVQALNFYARGGFDHGEAAQKALIAMTAAIEADHQTT